MQRKILLFSQAIVVLGLWHGFGAVTGRADADALAHDTTQDQYVQQQILDATVQITIEVPDPDSPNVTIVETAFGTVITEADATLLVTHNHWKQLSAETGLVTIRNINNKILFFSQLSDFRRRVRYTDEGTMIFKVPAMVKGYPVPITGYGKAQPGVGDTVLIVHREIPKAGSSEHTEVTLHRARVQAVEAVNGVPVYRLESLDGHSVVPGDSGGGVWFDGRFVANLWMTIMVESESVSPAVDTGNLPQPTNLSIAAQFPPC